MEWLEQNCKNLAPLCSKRYQTMQIDANKLYSFFFTFVILNWYYKICNLRDKINRVRKL
jgi:hypothetical protein